MLSVGELCNVPSAHGKGFVHGRYMKLYIGFLVLFLLCSATVDFLIKKGKSEDRAMKNYKELTPEEERVIIHRGTELPGSGEYLHNKAAGTYVCRHCEADLYRSADKFDSGCGWPAFDDEIAGAVRRTPDPDGRRTEITCAACGGHLGHVFSGERLTDKNVRHCVNSVSLLFVPEKEETELKKAYFAAGCFWGVEYWFKREPGVVLTRVGYMGGHLDQPTYRDVCGSDTGHAEVVEVTYDPKKTEYEKLCKLFFEIHDFTQVDGQGPDVGDQYRSEIFVADAEQKAVAERLIGELAKKGTKPSTRVGKAGAFWLAEDYHQDYYGGNGKIPYCHARRKVF